MRCPRSGTGHGGKNNWASRKVSLYEQGKTLAVRWIPGHQGTAGDEAADAYAKDAAARAVLDKDSRLAAERVSVAFLNGQHARRCYTPMEKGYGKTESGKEDLQAPGPISKPTLRPSLRTTPKALAGRF